MDSVAAAWTADRHELWQRIAAHEFEPPGQALPFTRRLARDRGWSLGFARAAVDEYRRFCFLARVAPRPVTPSEEVDEVWHAHLTYSRDYWDRWCGQALEAPLHHDPTEGGPAEQARYQEQYAETLALYEAWFGPPPEAFWPGTRQRFRPMPRFRVVDTDSVLVLRRPAPMRWLRRPIQALGLGAALLGAVAGPAQAQGLNPLDWAGGPFLLLYVVLAILSWLAGSALRARVLGRAAPVPAGGLGVVETAYLAGGEARAKDTVLLGWMIAGAAAPGGLAQTVRVQAGVALPPELRPFAPPASGQFTRADIHAALAARIGGLHEALVRRGLVPDAAMVGRAAAAAGYALVPVLLLGAAKVLVGLSRDRPVGLLCFLLAATVVAGLVRSKPRLTAAGKAALREMRARHGRAARAPRRSEVGLAFALLGAAALAATPYAAYAASFPQAPAGDGGSTGGDGGSSSSCSSGGDSGGGGGCGGCSG